MSSESDSAKSASKKGSGASSYNLSNSGLSRSQLLVMYGFVSKEGEKFWSEIKDKQENARRRAVASLDEETALKYSKQERFEISDEQWGHTGYPEGAIRYQLVYETSAENVEEVYFDLLERTRQGFGFPFQIKITDYFAASENSAFFGNSQQRVGLQQDRVQQFLANIGKFVKELFQMVRELRILDERLAMYNAAGGVGSMYCTGKDGGYTFKDHTPSPAADVSLKSVFTDLVEGGTKNPQSVFGLAQTVGFTLLPDLFFNEYVRAPNEVDKRVDGLEYNTSVKAVLKRKFFQYLTWKEKTYDELVSRRKFNIKYLRQHWTIIKLYMSWIKPYLRNIERLTMRADFMESPGIISAFESAVMEAEFISYRAPKSGYHPIICVSCQFRSRPDMNARKEYQQGPIHVGRADVTFRAYAWTPEQLANYRAMKRREEIELLSLLDVQLKDIMDSLGEEFEKYLEEAGEDILKEAEKPSTQKTEEFGALSPFIAIFGGVKELAGAFLPVPSGGGHSHKGHGANPKSAMRDASISTFLTYHTFKKSRRMITW
jgi:hypothetical protein